MRLELARAEMPGPVARVGRRLAHEEVRASRQRRDRVTPFRVARVRDELAAEAHPQAVRVGARQVNDGMSGDASACDIELARAEGDAWCMSRNGMPPKWSPCRWLTSTASIVDGSIARVIGGSAALPQSSRSVVVPSRTRTQLCDRPAGAEALPVPRKVTSTLIERPSPTMDAV